MKTNYQPRVLQEVRSIRDVMKDICLYNITNLPLEEAREYLEQEARPNTGAVVGLIYFTETEPIANLFYDEIVELLKETYWDKRGYENILSNLNDMAWFAFNYYIQDDTFREEVLKEKEKKLLS